MTTKKKLKEMGFEKSLVGYTKIMKIQGNRIIFKFYIQDETGSLNNIDQNIKDIQINSFTELIRWNTFYEKQQAKFAARDESQTCSKTQDHSEKYVKNYPTFGVRGYAEE